MRQHEKSVQRKRTGFYEPQFFSIHRNFRCPIWKRIGGGDANADMKENNITNYLPKKPKKQKVGFLVFLVFLVFYDIPLKNNIRNCVYSTASTKTKEMNISYLKLRQKLRIDLIRPFHFSRSEHRSFCDLFASMFMFNCNLLFDISFNVGKAL